jgi:dTDP-4-amino-4,6-dideoxygalactose transaminase
MTATTAAPRDLRRAYLPSWPGLNPRTYVQRESAIVPPFPLNAPNRTYSFVARNVIYHLFRALGFADGGAVLVPDYHHGNEVRAIRASGAEITWYHVGKGLRPDLSELSRLCSSRPRALFVIHYLGWPQPIEEIAELCRVHGILLIEDCALALFSEFHGRPLGSFGDYSVFCLYKTLPVPNGAILVQNRNLLSTLDALEFETCGVTSLAGRCLDLSLDWLKSRSVFVGGALSRAKVEMGRVLSGAGVKRMPVGDTGFNIRNINVGMSPLSLRLLRRFDYAEIRNRRRLNYLALLDRLGAPATLPGLDLPEGVCPLFFPLLVHDKTRAARALQSRGIGAVEFWNEGAPEAAADTADDALFLRRHLLELPIHQDLRDDQIRFMADQVMRLNLRM